MSSDRLAEIAARWRAGVYDDMVPDRTLSDVLALVEIAKEAEALIHDTRAGHPTTSIDRQIDRLADALARLDRTSSDGTADSGAPEGDA